MNVTLRGRVLEIIDSMIRDGYASTKSEAIRLAILNFRENHETEEEMLVAKKLDRINREIREGKRKLLNKKEALGVYAKYVKGSP